MTDYGSFDDPRVKHMEMIQAVIGRLGNDSFLIKGWAVTVAGAFLGFAANLDKWQLAGASVVPTVLFWIIDSFFLRDERLFRTLYDWVRTGAHDVEPFFMGATSPDFVKLVTEESNKDDSKPNVSSRWQTFWRRALSFFYGAMIASALVVALIICRS